MRGRVRCGGARGRPGCAFIGPEGSVVVSARCGGGGSVPGGRGETTAGAGYWRGTVSVTGEHRVNAVAGGALAVPRQGVSWTAEIAGRG